MSKVEKSLFSFLDWQKCSANRFFRFMAHSKRTNGLYYQPKELRNCSTQKNFSPVTMAKKSEKAEIIAFNRPELGSFLVTFFPPSIFCSEMIGAHDRIVYFKIRCKKKFARQKNHEKRGFSRFLASCQMGTNFFLPPIDSSGSLMGG